MICQFVSSVYFPLLMIGVPTAGLVIWLASLPPAPPPCVHSWEEKLRENGRWIEENYGYYSDGAYCRRVEITPLSVLQSPGGRKMTDRTDCRVREFRSVIIRKCRYCGEMESDYSELPVAAEVEGL